MVLLCSQVAAPLVWSGLEATVITKLQTRPNLSELWQIVGFIFQTSSLYSVRDSINVMFKNSLRGTAWSHILRTVFCYSPPQIIYSSLQQADLEQLTGRFFFSFSQLVLLFLCWDAECWTDTKQQQRTFGHHLSNTSILSTFRETGNNVCSFYMNKIWFKHVDHVLHFSTFLPSFFLHKLSRALLTAALLYFSGMYEAITLINHMKMWRWSVCFQHITFHSQKQREVGLFSLRSLGQDAAETSQVKQTQRHLFQKLVHFWHASWRWRMHQLVFVLVNKVNKMFMFQCEHNRVNDNREHVQQTAPLYSIKIK